MMRWLLFILCACLTINAHAADLKQSDISLIESAGIPIYSKANFVYGNPDVGFRFATSISPDIEFSLYPSKHLA
ncbi:hypothetical protein ACFL0B_08920 [Thermodesulfobacteriota bacterium]|jgi:hypothetical protein|nr:hypothetical protein [Desulfobacteraceae bacterium]MDH3838246.1 hypothetical protein [Desulfobacteraceae bacterium]